MSFQFEKSSRVLPAWLAWRQPTRGVRVIRASSRREFVREFSDDRPRGLAPWKRTSDIVLSTLGIVLLLPVALMVMTLIKLTSPGPVIYRQERLGLNRRERDRRVCQNGLPSSGNRRSSDRRYVAGFGMPFTMYKFRTMRTDAETHAPQWCSPNDPRVTWIGRILRKSRLDEIPQLVNVLRGDMSLVGPRPERAFFFAQTQSQIPNFKARLRAKPGLTGLAQVEHGYTNSVAGLNQKLKLDLRYIGHVSLATDAKILLRTITVVLTGRGAF